MPGNIGININGSQIVRPSVVTQINTNAMVPASGVLSDVPGVIGYADGGVPNFPYVFSSFAAAAAVLRGGNILSYLSRIFNPSPNVTGPGSVVVVRAGASGVTQATAAVAGMTLTTEDYGLNTNGVSVQIASDTSWLVGGYTVPAWDVTVRRRSDGVSRTYVCGPAVVATSSATLPQIKFDHVNKICSMIENAVTVATLAYPNDSINVSALAAWISLRSTWTAIVSPGADPSLPLRFMDNPVTPQSITATSISIPANQGMAIYEINQLDNECTAVLTTPANPYTVLSVVAETYFSGGTGNSTAAYSGADYTAALAIMDTQNVQALFMCDGPGWTTANFASFQAQAYADVLACRTLTRKKYRILFTGGPAAQTVAAAAGIPATMAGPVVYAWNGVYGMNPITNVSENLGGLGTAALLCGISCGSTPGQPITNKALVSYGVEFANPQDSDITTLLTAGVSPVILDPATGQTLVVQGLTTWQGGTNVSFRILQGLRVQDALCRLFNSVLAKFLGYPLDLMTGNLIVAEASKNLDSVVVSPQNTGGYLTPGSVGGTQIPAWSNLSVTTDGLQSWTISVQAHPVCETDYIQVVVNLTPVSINL